MKHRGKELLTTEFRCFTNYPRLTQSHCSSTDPPLVYPLSHRLSVSSFSLILPCREALQELSSRRYPSSSQTVASPLPRPLPSRASLYRAPSREAIISQGPLANIHPILRTLSISAPNRCDSRRPIERRRASDLPRRRTRAVINEPRKPGTTDALIYMLCFLSFSAQGI